MKQTTNRGKFVIDSDCDPYSYSMGLILNRDMVRTLFRPDYARSNYSSRHLTTANFRQAPFRVSSECWVWAELSASTDYQGSPPVSGSFDVPAEF